MSLRSIFFVAVTLIIGVSSCSLEDDCLIGDDGREDIGNSTDTENKEAYLSFRLDTDEVSSCSIVLIDGNNNVLSVRDGVKVVDGKLQDGLLFTKIRNDLKVAVIANTTQSFQNCATLKEVRQTIQGFADLEAGVMYGEAKVLFEGITVPTSSTPPVVSVDITLKRLSAIVELANFNIRFDETTGVKEAVITNVSLLSNVQYYTNSVGMFKDSTLTQTMEMNVNDFSKISFPSFPNSGVYLAVTLRVDSMQSTYTYKVNKGFVDAGYIYRLTVNLTPKGREGEIEVQEECIR